MVQQDRRLSIAGYWLARTRASGSVHSSACRPESRTPGGVFQRFSHKPSTTRGRICVTSFMDVAFERNSRIDDYSGSTRQYPDPRGSARIGRSTSRAATLKPDSFRDSGGGDRGRPGARSSSHLDASVAITSRSPTRANQTALVIGLTARRWSPLALANQIPVLPRRTQVCQTHKLGRGLAGVPGRVIHS